MASAIKELLGLSDSAFRSLIVVGAGLIWLSAMYVSYQRTNSDLQGLQLDMSANATAVRLEELRGVRLEAAVKKNGSDIEKASNFQNFVQSQNAIQHSQIMQAIQDLMP